MKIIKITSGGQTGVDRAALDAAIACGVPHGGWCPKGRLAEDGPIPSIYHLQETDSGEYPVRTQANVEAADLTLIFSHGPLTGGSLLTRQFAEELGKPCVHIDLSENLSFPSTPTPSRGGEASLAMRRVQGLETDCVDRFEFFRKLETTGRKVPGFVKIILNVAGPRASTDPEIYNAVYEEMVGLLHECQARTGLC